MPTCPKCLGNRYLNSHGGPAYSDAESNIQCTSCKGFGFVDGGGRGGGAGSNGIRLSGSAQSIILIAGGIGGFIAYSAHAPHDFAYIAAVLGFLVLAIGARVVANFVEAPVQMFLGIAMLVGLDQVAFEGVALRWLGRHGINLVGTLFTG